MRAFIIRPFGTKNNINFDDVEAKLIDPALTRLGVTGRTTGEIIRQGNIRADMFSLLLTADLVVADLSIHNANVFYELGVRHSLRDRHTFLLRSDVDRLPFDLQTDRYFTYNKDAPEGDVERLYAALRDTLDSGKTNSPVFASLPNMKEQDPSRFVAVPPGFAEEVERAVAESRLGDLGLLASEARGFDWEVEGLRAVGRAQYQLKDFRGAKNTWEAVRRNSREFDLQANVALGTIYQRLGDLTRSTQALERALDAEGIGREDRAEVYALLARNAKSQWEAEWEEAAPDPAARAAAALRSGLLQKSFENYERAYEEDLNHYYPGLNALAMLRVTAELATAQPDVWAERFDTDEEAERELTSLKAHGAKLAASVEISLDATLGRLRREDRGDVWVEVSAADLRCLTSNRPQRVAAAYGDALAGAPEQVWDSVRNQLAVYSDLGVFAANVAAAVKVTGLPQPRAEGEGCRRVLVFTGHMIDAPGRKAPRFPAEKEQAARQAIKEAVEAEMGSGGVAFGIAGGASGGDILFHEVCHELGVPTQLYLAFQSGLYVTASVGGAGPEWVERFRRLHARLDKQEGVRTLSELGDEPADKAEYLPTWLRPKRDYNIWQRTNLWMLHNALAAGGDDCVTLIALWDREPAGDGPGGTGDLVQRAERRGAKTVILDTKKIFGL